MKPNCFRHSHTLIQWLAVCTLKVGLRSRVEKVEEVEYGILMYASPLITFKPFLRSGVHNLQIPNFFLLFKNVKSSVILFGSGHEKQVIIGNWLNIIHIVHSYLHNTFCKPWLRKWNNVLYFVSGIHWFPLITIPSKHLISLSKLSSGV